MQGGDETQSGGAGPQETGSTEERATPPASAAIGQIGRFVVLRRLGRGGMGVVYLAYDNDLDRKVAIKVLQRRHADDHATTLRMQREAQAMARINHPNVLRVYEVGVADERIHVAMEYVEGETLRTWLARRGPPADRADLRERLAIFASAGAGLAAAHDAGLVHRDFKPDNVLLDARGGVHVADFGLARSTGDAPEPPRSGLGSVLSLELTATRAVLGTPAYMAPEQHAGLALDVPADIFAFCVSLHEGLYGVRPFAGESVEAIAEAAAREQVRPPPPGSPVPAWLRAVILRGLRSDPAARWPSMQALLAALADDPIARRRRRRLIAAAALTLLAAAVLVALSIRGAARQLDDQAAQVGEIRVERDAARERAEASARETRDLLRMAVLRDVADDPTSTLLVLAEVEDPAATPGWLTNAQALLQRPVSAAILRGSSPVLAATFVGEASEGVVVHTRDGHLRLFRRDGRGAPRDVDLGVGLPAMVPIDRRRVAAPLDDRRVGIWRADPAAAALERVAVLEGAPPRVSALVRDPSGRRLAALGAREPRAAVWELDRGERVGELGCDDEPIYSAEISRDGAHLLISHDGGAHCVHDLDGGAAPVVLARWATGDFLPDGDIVLFDDDRAALWPWRSGRRPRPRVDRHDVFRWGTDPTGRFLISIDFDGELLLHPLAGDPRERAIGASPFAHAALFSADGAWLAVAADRRIILWRTDDLQRRAVLRGPELVDVTLAFSDDGEWLLAGTDGGDVHVWRLAELDLNLHIETDEESVHGITPAPEGRTVAALAGDDVVWYEIPGDEASVRRHTLDWVFASAVDDDARVAAISVSGRGDIAVFDGASARPRRLLGHRGPVIALDLSRGARWLLSGSYDATARLWDLEAGASPRVLVGHEGPIHGAALSDDGARAATLGVDGSLRLWDLRGVDPPASELLVAADRGGAHDLHFSPDGRWLVALTRDPSAYLWDLEAGGPPRRLAHDGPPNDACWDPAGRWLAIAAADGSARIWDPLGERPPIVHAGHGAPVTQIACAPDSRSVATVSEAQRVHLWPSDRPGDAELHVVEAGRVQAIAFSREGDALLIGAGDGVLTRWTPRFAFTVAIDEVRERLRAATTACLSVRQRVWLLRESPERARERFAACERRFDRAPP